MAKKVLMVDDSKTTRDMVSFTLRRAGYEVIVAEDGRGAISALGGGAVDCIITDLNMPVMDGIELIKDLRSKPIYRTTPILMLTTQSDAAKQEAGKQAGATGWLNKPFHPKSLIETISKLI